jgi:uncharacterized protein YndB with AHSA1/START domain
MHIEESVEINCPVEEVFAYAANPEHFPEWSGIILEVHKEEPDVLAEGERFTSASKFLGRRFESPFEVQPTCPTAAIRTGARGLFRMYIHLPLRKGRGRHKHNASG